MLAEIGREDDALSEYRTTLELDPSHRLALFQLARRHLEAGEFEQAISLLQPTLDAPIDAKTAGVLYTLADAYARSGNPERAILHARQALELANEFGDEQMAASIESDLRGLGAIP
jgi:tetratricopeptide (TPR) repeat protein